MSAKSRRSKSDPVPDPDLVYRDEANGIEIHRKSRRKSAEMPSDAPILRSKRRNAVSGIDAPERPIVGYEQINVTGPTDTEQVFVDGRPIYGQPMRRIAIVGYTTTRELALAPEWTERWGMNNLHQLIPPAQFARWYDLHPNSSISTDAIHEQWLMSGASGLPVFVWEPQDKWPTSVAFPRREITDAFGTYFTNSVSWMIAHAMAEGVTHLGLFGIDMATGSEYAAQRPSVEYFIGLARGQGIEVTIPDQSDLLQGGGLYGTSDDPSGLRAKLEQRLSELRQMQGDASNARDHNDRLWHQCQGAIENLSYMHDVWTMPNAKREG